MAQITMKSVLMIGAAICMLATQAYAERTMRMTVQVGANHPVGANTHFFAQELERISGGELKVEVYDSAQLFKGQEVPQAISSGAIDLGIVLADEYAGSVPAAGIFSVAFLFPDYQTLAKAAARDGEFRKTFDEILLGAGSRVLWWQDYGPVQLLSKGGPIATPDDMKGKMVRALGKPSGDLIEAAGGSAVVIGGAEQFVAYQRGVVDIGMSGTTAVKSRALYEVMDNVTMTNHSLAEFIAVINPALWGSMSEQEQAWVTEASILAEQQLRASTEAENVEAAKWLSDGGHATVTELTPDQIAVWKEATKPAVDRFRQDAGELGEKLLNALAALE
ncbi:MAG: TRAP transporter substrate-binding protein DctP [Paracoccus sp. (in: a-proteobacteria)]|uniref:TRAP transporter substrate-binding protein DctP n=1 Tax=Paracoccus sp. TaxID=267 RepID=UPI0026DFEC82|nr:TRAP transporter substrate-binding protein DctP [Paracoccus sp. (in: a-proteobacteria)]MDO5632374.1 TRAP transporter substrate-binding protein DctP [Paracoccus sp. (in: a-proteobacteria)]